MKWDQGHESRDLIDRRGEGGGGGGLGAIFYLIPFILRLPGGWIILLVLAGAALFFGGGLFGGRGVTGSPAATGDPSQDKMARFVGFVLDDAQDTFTRVFAAEGKTYERAKLVLFSGATQTACGQGRAATGPFYCPADRRVYIDLSFYRALEKKLGAGGDFAQAYVIAHEVGHHVQHQLGAMDRVGRKSEGASGASVRLELQADCYAGIWAHSTRQRNLLEQGDLDEALGAAAAIGDDRLQKQSSGTVAPETFTHGTSEQRARWFKRGYETGKLASCDTFSAPTL